MTDELYSKAESKSEKSEYKIVKMYLPVVGKKLRLTHRLVYGNAIAIADKKIPKSKVAQYLELPRRTFDDSLAGLKKLDFLDDSEKPKPVPDMFMSRKPAKGEPDIWQSQYQYFPLYLPLTGKLLLDEAAVYSRLLNHEKGLWSNRIIEHNVGISHNRVSAILNKLQKLGLIEKSVTENQHYRIIVVKKPDECGLFAKVGDKPAAKMEVKRTEGDKYGDYCMKCGIAPDTAKRIAKLGVEVHIGNQLGDLVAECQEEHDTEKYGKDFGPLLYTKLKQWKPEVKTTVIPKMTPVSNPQPSLTTIPNEKPRLVVDAGNVNPAPITAMDRKSYVIKEPRPKWVLEKEAIKRFGVDIHAVNNALYHAIEVGSENGRDTGGQAGAIIEGALAGGLTDVGIAMIDSVMLLPQVGREFNKAGVYA